MAFPVSCLIAIILHALKPYSRFLKEKSDVGEAKVVFRNLMILDGPEPAHTIYSSQREVVTTVISATCSIGS